MLIRSLISILIVASSVIFVTAQTPDAAKSATDKAAKSTSVTRTTKLRDLQFPNGVDLQYLIQDLALEMDLNVLFDPESFRARRKTSIALRNVTTAAALDYILLQEGLVSEEVGPRTIMVAGRSRGTSIPHIGVGMTPLTEQLAKYFGVEGGILINNVHPDSPGSKAGLKAGDVIAGIDGAPVRGPLVLIRAINAKNDGDITLNIVRDHKEHTITVTRPDGQYPER